jgi:mRNA interferase MazF
VKYNRLDIVLVKLDPTVGSEIKKTRPCVILSPNLINHNSKTVLIAAITHFDENKAVSPLFVPILASGSTGLTKKSLVTLMQMRTIDISRIIKKMGKLPKQCETSLEFAIKLGTGLERVE